VAEAPSHQDGQETEWKGLGHSSSSDLLPPAGYHLLKFPELPSIASPVRNQMLHT
jgi:hypothetical protein